FFEMRSQLGKELYESYPDNVSFKNGLAVAYSKLGATHSALGDLNKALDFFEKRSQLGKELYDSYPNNVSFKNGLALSYQWLGWFLENKKNDTQKAKANYNLSKTLLAELASAYPAYVEFQKNLNWVADTLKRLE
ncbi:MAG: hypothetical protein QG594_504, partial [Bacteroidota bacterium]|nr:hypothetical protein [Bacteroidota bacterium]